MHLNIFGDYENSIRRHKLLEETKDYFMPFVVNNFLEFSNIESGDIPMQVYSFQSGR